MDVHVIVEGQRMMLQDGSYRYSPHSQKFVRFVFELSDDWSGQRVFAQFAQGETAYNSYLDSNNSAYLPHEIQPGQCLMMLYGTNNESRVIGTSLPAKLFIADSGYIEDASSTGITRTLYMQLIDDLQEQYDLFTEHVEEEIAGKSDVGHDHDSRYYTESEVDAKLNGKSDTSHIHDNRYYTESEVDTKLSTKLNVSDVATLEEVKAELNIN